MKPIITPQNQLDGGFAPPAQPFPFQQPTNVRWRLNNKSRVKHLFIASLASFVALFFITILIFHGYIAWLLAYPYVAPISSNPQESIGLSYEDVVFPSQSGQSTVSGWFIPSTSNDTALIDLDDNVTFSTAAAAESSRTIIFSHGYGANREEAWVPMYELSKLVHGLNYNVLLFDYGYASEQYRAPATGGLEESQQLLAAVNYVKSRGAEKIIVWGFSMGAGTALQTALLTDSIDAMILDSLFIPSSEALFDNLNQFVSLPKFPSLSLIESMIPLWTGTSFGSIPAERLRSNDYRMPLYIIHGTNDAKAPHTAAETLAAQQQHPLSRSWIVQDGQHEMIFRNHPREYIQRAALFLSQVNQLLQAEQDH